MKKQDLVSIVTPVFNAEKFIKETILTVQDQTYSNWELLVVDDCSLDSSVKIVQELQKTDKRIKLFRLEKNSGVAMARNRGVSEAEGRYIAFLDADDLWDPEKLTMQVDFMKKSGSSFSFTGYLFADEKGQSVDRRVHVPYRMSKIDYLKNNLIWTSTVMIDTLEISKEHFIMPDLSYGEDAIAWSNILTKIDYAYGLDEANSLYRRTSSSLSANKLKAIGKKWDLYQQFDGIPVFHRTLFFCLSLYNATRKRL